MLKSLSLAVLTLAVLASAEPAPRPAQGAKTPGFAAVYLKSKADVLKAYGKPVFDTGPYDEPNADFEPGHKGESLFFAGVAGAKRVEIHLFDGKATGLNAVYGTGPAPGQIEALLGIGEPLELRDLVNSSNMPEELWQKRLATMKNKGFFTGTPRPLTFAPKDAARFPQQTENTTHAVYRVESISDPAHAKRYDLAVGDTWVQIQFNFSKV